MHNPFKIISIAFIISLTGMFGLIELPKLLVQFNRIEWLMAIVSSILLTMLMLINILSNSQKLQKAANTKSIK